MKRLAYTIDEVATALGISNDAVYGAIARGEIQSRKIGGRKLVSAVELDRVLGVEHEETDTNVLQQLADLLKEHAS